MVASHLRLFGFPLIRKIQCLIMFLLGCASWLVGISMMANYFPIELLVLPALQRNPKTKKIHKNKKNMKMTEDHVSIFLGVIICRPRTKPLQLY